MKYILKFRNYREDEIYSLGMHGFEEGDYCTEVKLFDSELMCAKSIVDCMIQDIREEFYIEGQYIIENENEDFIRNIEVLDSNSILVFLVEFQNISENIKTVIAKKILKKR